MRIDALTGLRFFAALHVVLFHFAVPLYDQAPLPIRALMQAGDASVTLFFMLSGFVLAYTYLGPTRLPIRLGRFWLARFARIYPAFLLAELLMLPYMLARQGAEASTPAQTAAVFALLQDWSPVFAHAWNAPGWSLSVEAFFYAAFPFIAPAIARLNIRGIWSLGMVLCALEALRAISPTFLLRTSPLAYLPEFLLGVCLGCAFLRHRKQGSGLWLGVFGVIGSATTPWLAQVCGIPIGPLMVACFALLIYGLALGGGWLAALLASPVVVLGGEASYALYILQAHVFFWAGVPSAPRNDDPLFIFAFLLVLLASALFTLRYIERPLRRAIVGFQLPALVSPRPKPYAQQ